MMLQVVLIRLMRRTRRFEGRGRPFPRAFPPPLKNPHGRIWPIGPERARPLQSIDVPRHEIQEEQAMAQAVACTRRRHRVQNPGGCWGTFCAALIIREGGYANRIDHCRAAPPWGGRGPAGPLHRSVHSSNAPPLETEQLCIIHAL